MTTWDLLDGVGIIKPDLITLGEEISGLNENGQCTTRSGTSVSSSILTGAIAAVLSGFETSDELHLRSPAVVKRALKFEIVCNELEI